MGERCWLEGQSPKTWKEIGTRACSRSENLRASNRLCAGTTRRSMPRPKRCVSRSQKIRASWCRASNRGKRHMLEESLTSIGMVVVPAEDVTEKIVEAARNEPEDLFLDEGLLKEMASREDEYREQRLR